MIKKRSARLAVLACAVCASLWLLAMPGAAGAKTKTGQFTQCVNAAVNIPDGPAPGSTATNPAASFAIPVSVPKFRGKQQDGVVTRFNSVGVRISHTDDGDLALFLVSPGGRAIALATYRDNSSDDSGDGYGTGPVDCSGSLVRFGDAFGPSITTPGNFGNGTPIAGSFKPEQPTSTFVGGPARGFWTLIVQDIQNTDVGQINALSLSFDYSYKAKKKKKKRR
jgi:Proprotein convertase P-domain